MAFHSILTLSDILSIILDQENLVQRSHNVWVSFVRAAINLFNLKAEKIMKELDKQSCHYRNVLQFERQVKAITQSQLVTWWIVRGCTDRWWLQAYFHMWLQQSEGICQYAISCRCTPSSRVIQWTKVQQITPKHYASWVTAFLFHHLMQSLTDCKSIGSCENF